MKAGTSRVGLAWDVFGTGYLRLVRCKLLQDNAAEIRVNFRLSTIELLYHSGDTGTVCDGLQIVVYFKTESMQAANFRR